MSLEMSQAMKRFNQFSMNKSKRYVKHLLWVEDELEQSYAKIQELIEHKEDLKNANCPDLKELKQWNII